MSAYRQLEIGPGNWERWAAPAVTPAHWTAVVPAAGRGSRLGFARPKILYPVAGRTILEWLLDMLAPAVAHVVLVLSPEGEPEVAPEAARLAPGCCRTVIQPEPKGMGDAVECGLSEVATPHVAVVWGDQVALRRESVAACLRLHEGSLSPHVTCPTVIRAGPYIHFERDPAGRLIALRQAREGDPMPATGESDTGLFCFETTALRAWLQELRRSREASGRATGEFNLLPVIPHAARQGARVLTPRLMSLEETIGINTAADAEVVAGFLRSHGVSY